MNIRNPLSRGAALFTALEKQPADSLLQLIDLYRADSRASKIDLGVGVYRDDQGVTPVLRAVKAAEETLWRDQPTKAYLAPEGDARFVELLQLLVFGAGRATDPRLTGVQSTGGTGALRMGADLIARARPGARVWIADPTWPNHAPILDAAGLRIAIHPFFDAVTQSIRFEEMLAALEGAARGDVLLLQACCHNPTGADFTPAQWAALAELMSRLGVVPFFDLAYQGLGHGLDIDAQGTRTCLEQCPEALVAYSCDKNFGLYRERTGALWVQSGDGAGSATARSNMLAIARANWSMPPDHGAAVVRLILEAENLRQLWADELQAMRERIGQLRILVAALHPALRPLAEQSGMFSLLPLGVEKVRRLREEAGVYMVGTGRINVAGLQLSQLEPLKAVLAPYLYFSHP